MKITDIRYRKRLLWFIAIVGFLASLYLTELSPFSSRAVALHNDGYGTFDMTPYSTTIINKVLARTDNFSIYYKYYVCDFIFIFFFGFFQIMVSKALYLSKKHVLKKIAVSVPIFRGILDSIENIILMYTISRYPDISSTLVTVSSIMTKCKFACIGIWVALTIYGIICNVIKRNRNISNSIENNINDNK